MTVLDNIKLRAKNISKSYGEEPENRVFVVDNISMEIAEKELVVILGPTGCGKSTFMKILGGIQSASSGSIELDGTDYGQELPRDLHRKFGFVFQGDNLLQWRTVEGNLKFNLETMHLKGEKWNKRVDEMLEIVGLSQYRGIYPHELSGGMKQRTGIARALVHDPEVLLMDQPFGALDAITRRMLTFETLHIWRETQKTIVMVTNNVDEAITLANRVFIFSPMPAHILHEVRIDIPDEQRDNNIGTLPKFLEYRKLLNEYVRSTMAGMEA